MKELFLEYWDLPRELETMLDLALGREPRLEGLDWAYFDRLVEQQKCRDCITEALKAADQLEWVQRMNGIRHEAMEAVEKELICV